MDLARRLAMVLSLAVLLSAIGCQGDGAGRGTAGNTHPKLLVLGLDAADWHVMDPLMAQGRLPNLKALRAQSASGRMQTFYPPAKSPLLWASICTGVLPPVHGVENFVEGFDDKPVTGSAWRAPAIWDIIGAADRTTYISGMWVTYPARPIKGVMISDYLQYGSDQGRPLAGVVSPDSLSGLVVACRVAPKSITDAQLSRFLPAGTDIAAMERTYPEQFRLLREIWAYDQGYFEVARRLKGQRTADLYFLYVRGTDMISHIFFRYRDDAQPDPPPDPAARDLFKDVVARYYEWVDESVGEVLSWFPADYPTVVVSDHGFHGPRPGSRGGVQEHAEWGVFMVRSPLYVAGADFSHLKLMDICPTMLALLDLPPAKDMPGAVLAEALTPDGLKHVQRIEQHRVDSYQALRPAPPGAPPVVDEKVNEEIRRQLRSLGYIR